MAILMYDDDSICDENYQVECDFINSHTEEELAFAATFMQPCIGCGEWVNKKNIKSGFCNLCNKSKQHADIRGQSCEAGDNFRDIDRLMDKLQDY